MYVNVVKTPCRPEVVHHCCNTNTTKYMKTLLHNLSYREK